MVNQQEHKRVMLFKKLGKKKEEEIILCILEKEETRSSMHLKSLPYLNTQHVDCNTFKNVESFSYNCHHYSLYDALLFRIEKRGYAR